MLSRNTYMEVYLNNIKNNIQKIIKKHNEYEYYFGVVKADCYGHENGVIPKMIEAGVNYLAVATFEEALAIRNENADIPILCLGIVPKEYIKEAIGNKITLTINSIEYLEEIEDLLNEKCKVHIKLNTGMNRLGIKNEKELEKVYCKLKDANVDIEGIYSHIYEASNEELYNKQLKKYKKMLDLIEGTKIKIKHISASEAMEKYKKPEYINGCRLGIIMYGFTDEKDLELKPTFKLKSEVIQINTLEEGETLGYNATYTAKEKTKIAVVPIGYADGVIRKNKGRNVYINNKPCEIIGNICMDMLFVKIDDSIKVHDTVEILRDIEHVNEVAKHLDTISYEVICNIGKRVPRIYV